MLLVANFLSCADKGGRYILATHRNHVAAEARPRFGSDKYAVQGLEQFAWLKPVLPCCGEYHVPHAVLTVSTSANDRRKVKHRTTLCTPQPHLCFSSTNWCPISAPTLRYPKP